MNRREMKALFVLSIVVPVSLLTSLRLTGILQEQITISETITLENIKWDFKRPNQSVTPVADILKSSYCKDETSTIMSLMIWSYRFDALPSPPKKDLLSFLVIVNSTVSATNGFVESIYVFLHKDNQSTIDWLTSELQSENLSLTSSAWGDIGSKIPYIGLKGVEHPKRVYLSEAVLWGVSTLDNQTRQLEAFFELTYHNGTAYKKVVQPFQLKLLGS